MEVQSIFQSQFKLFCFKNYQVKDDEVGKACSVIGGEEEHI
jgi:hypothetical protein